MSRSPLQSQRNQWRTATKRQILGNFSTQTNSPVPVDGSNPATDWQGLHTVEEIVTVVNPENGWIQNCNSTPFTAAGAFSPVREDYPAYIAPEDEHFRGIHAARVLDGISDLTLDGLIEYRFNLANICRARVALNVYNLTDDQALYGFIYAPGRSARVSLGLEF